MNFDYIQNLLKYDWSSKVTYRVKLLDQNSVSAWDKFLIAPTDSYLEICLGPIAFSNVEYIDINPIEQRYMGKLVPNKFVDHSAEINEALDFLKVSFINNEGVFRVLINN